MRLNLYEGATDVDSDIMCTRREMPQDVRKEKRSISAASCGAHLMAAFTTVHFFFNG